ncbi:MAG: TlpA family protein disulfide reductase [Planctomycetales bacterium]|nr:TlpA family protein disulfide reductase [Planctomycetales bacterium]
MNETLSPSGRTPNASPPSFGWLAIAVVAAAGVTLAVAVWPRGAPQIHPAVGKPLATLDLTPLTSAAEPLQADDLEGRVTLLNFWGPWCGICRKELPHLVALGEKYADEPAVQLLFVSCDGSWLPHGAPAIVWSEDLAQLSTDTQEALSSFPTPPPTYADVHGHTREALAAMGGWEGYPTTLLIDQAGVVRNVWVGYQNGDEQEIEQQLRSLIRNARERTQ